jgi:histidine ammonia-lyase
VRAQRAELSGTALPPVIDDDLVHHIGERELDSAHRSVRDDEAARFDPTRLEVRLGALEAGRLDHHVCAAEAILPALGDPDRLSQVSLEPLRELLAALAPARMDADLVEVEDPVEEPHVPVRGSAGADMPEHSCVAPSEVARPERRDRTRAHLGELRGADDGCGHPRACVVERQEAELRRQAALVVVEVVADDLDARKLERLEVAAQDVEVAPQRRIRLEVDAGLDQCGPGALSPQSVLDGGEYLLVRQREPRHIDLAEEDKLGRLHGRSRPHALQLDGFGLTAEDVVGVAREGAHAELGPDARMRMAAARDIVERYIAEGRPAYGLTTGLGARVVESVAGDALAEFSRHTVLGRANSVGAPLPTEVVRAAMLVRANGLARGGSGARPGLADALLALLERGVHPVVPSIGSIGAGDICVLAHIALVLIGEGEAELRGELMPGAQALAAAGLEPLELAPKDGLAAISSNAVSAACAALALVDGRAALVAAHAAAALSLEGFRASLTPLDERVVEARPAPGQAACAASLRALLAGGSLVASGGRRLQDPLSFRCVSQVHGSLATAFELLADALEPELNGAGDNPLVLADPGESDGGEIVSTGNFLVPVLALAADAVALALAQVASLTAARAARLLTATVSDLPQNLAPAGSTGAGMAPLLKVADALAAEIAHGAAPATLASLSGTDAVEDAATGAPLATMRLSGLLERFRLLTALELVVAAQAVDLAQVEELGAGTSAIHAVVRELVEPMLADRPLGGDVERVAAQLTRVRAAVSVR